MNKYRVVAYDQWGGVYTERTVFAGSECAACELVRTSPICLAAVDRIKAFVMPTEQELAQFRALISAVL